MPSVPFFSWYSVYKRQFMFFIRGALQSDILCGQLGMKLRWKQVRFLRGSVTVLMEFCQRKPLDELSGKAGKALKSESEDMHRVGIFCYVGRT